MYIVIFVCLSLQLCCCQVNDRCESSVTSLNMNSAVKVDFDEIVEEVSCIALEDLPDAYMTDCWKILKYKDNFYKFRELKGNPKNGKGK